MDCVERNKQIYEKAFRIYGDDTRSCLWEKPMVMRYQELLKIADLTGNSVLDIGCGLGGLYEYITRDREIRLSSYKEIDLVEGMVDLAGRKYPEASFEVRNIFEAPIEESYDYVFCCGLFNNAIEDSDRYMKEMLKAAFSCCTKGMGFTFISSYVNFKDKEMAYHNPTDVLDFCLRELSWKAELHHHYAKCDVSAFVYR